MTVDDQITQAAEQTRAARRRPRELARRSLRRLAGPYLRRRSRAAATATAVARLEGEFDHLRVRHTEQIARLEDLVRELILTAESLRRGISDVAKRDEG